MKTTFKKYTEELYRVYQDYAVAGILFSTAGIFRTRIQADLKYFPILYLKNNGFCGDFFKEDLIYFTKPNLENFESIIKSNAQPLVLELKCKNKINARITGLLKGVYDGITIQTATANNQVTLAQLDKYLIIVGNAELKEELLSRTVLCELDNLNYGYSHQLKELDFMKFRTATIFNEINNYKIKFEASFYDTFLTIQKDLSNKYPSVLNRIVSIYTLLFTTYYLLKDSLVFPFSQDEVLNSLTNLMVAQDNLIKK